MKANYQNGKVYGIYSSSTDKIYIGSTTQPLCKRLQQHKTEAKMYDTGTKAYKTTSYDLVKMPDCYIELIEMYPCNTREELSKREGQVIRENKDTCINRYIAGRTIQEYNKEHYSEKGKEYYNDNKEHITQRQKEYHQMNIEKIHETQKTYRQNNKEKINKRKRELRKERRTKKDLQQPLPNVQEIAPTIQEPEHSIKE